MGGQIARRRGRPRKTASRAFRLLVLAGFARPLSQERLAAQVSAALGDDSVSQPTVGKWLHYELARFARPTVAIKRPDDLEIRVAFLLFRRAPARAIPLMRTLARELHVSRVERWRGDVSVFAEVIALDERAIDDVIARYEPDAVYQLIERRERARVALRRVGRQAIARDR